MINKIKQNRYFLILLIVPMIVLVSTFGRFVYLEVTKYFFTTQNFYFESDKLKENRATYQINNYNGVDNYNITINLNSLKNNKLKATTDINYDVTYTCSAKANCSSSKNDGTIYASTNTDYFIATIAPSAQLADQEVIWIEVKAKATSPYEKEISAIFILKVGYYGLSHVISDEVGNPYMELKITNTLDYYEVRTAFDSYNVGDKLDISTYLSLSQAKKDNCASAVIGLSFNPNLVLLDMTSLAYDNAYGITGQTIGGYDYINGFTFEVDAISSVIVRFYKKDKSLNYTYPITNPTSIITVTYD